MGLNGFKPQKRNANKHNPRGLKALDDSIQRDGFIGAITTAADGEVFAGSARLERSADIFGTEIEPVVIHATGDRPIIVVRDDIPTADDPRAKRLAVADNVVGKIDFEPDIDLLAELAGEDPAIADLLKQDADLSGLLAKGGAKEETADSEELTDRADELNEKWHCAVGDVWAIGEHRLFCCDSETEFVKMVGDTKAVLTFTDPPYGINVVTNLSATVGGGKPVTIGAIRARRKYPFGGVKNVRGSDGASNWVDATPYKPVIGDDKPFDPAWLMPLSENHIIWGGNYFASKLADSRCWLVWDKNNTGNFADCELAWTNFEKSVRIYRHTWNGLVREGDRKLEGKKRIHPTQKPVTLLANIIRDFTDEGDLILDPYSGSGSTFIAAVLNRRRCYAAELEPSYIAVTLERLSLLGLHCERINE